MKIWFEKWKWKYTGGRKYNFIYLR